MHINVNKTKWMKIGNRADILDICPKIDNIPLEKVSEYHYLGITIAENLNFTKHEDTVYNNVVFRVHRFADIRKYMDVEDALTLYKTTILPLMDYIDIVWDKATVGFSERFQLLQNKALRIVYKVKLEPHPIMTTVYQK